jgi:hypothetical protein
MMKNNPKRNSDATVAIADGIQWMQELVKEPALDLASKLAEFEPCIIGVGVRLADETQNRLLRRGASMEIASHAADRVLLACCIGMELQRRGHSRLWEDLWSPSDPAEDQTNGK